MKGLPCKPEDLSLDHLHPDEKRGPWCVYNSNIGRIPGAQLSASFGSYRSKPARDSVSSKRWKASEDNTEIVVWSAHSHTEMHACTRMNRAILFNHKDQMSFQDWKTFVLMPRETAAFEGVLVNPGAAG